MNIDNLASMFSQRNGVQQSVASTLISTIIGYVTQNLMQKGLGSMLNSGGNDRSGMQSALSQLDGDLNNQSHPLVQQIQHNCGLNDQNQARNYAHQGIGMLRENTDNDPQGLSSLLGSFMGGNKGGVSGLGEILGGSGDSGKQRQNDKKGGIGDLLGI